MTLDADRIVTFSRLVIEDFQGRATAWETVVGLEIEYQKFRATRQGVCSCGCAEDTPEGRHLWYFSGLAVLEQIVTEAIE